MKCQGVNCNREIGNYRFCSIECACYAGSFDIVMGQSPTGITWPQLMEKTKATLQECRIFWRNKIEEVKDRLPSRWHDKLGDLKGADAIKWCNEHRDEIWTSFMENKNGNHN